MMLSNIVSASTNPHSVAWRYESPAIASPVSTNPCDHSAVQNVGPDPLSSPLLGNTVTTPLRGLLLERSTRSKLNAAQECRGGSCMCVVDKADILYEFPYSTQVRRLMPAAKPSTHLNGWKAKSGRRSGERNGLHLVAVLGHVPFTEAPIILWQHCAGAAAHRMGCTLAHRV
jgi:hypothetical protein